MNAETDNGVLKKPDRRDIFATQRRFLEGLFSNSQYWFAAHNQGSLQILKPLYVRDWSVYGGINIRKGIIIFGEEKTLALVLGDRIRRRSQSLPSLGLEFGVVRTVMPEDLPVPGKPVYENLSALGIPPTYKFTPEELVDNLSKIVHQEGIHNGEIYMDPLSGHIQLDAVFNRSKYGGAEVFSSRRGPQILTPSSLNASLTVIKRTVENR